MSDSGDPKQDKDRELRAERDFYESHPTQTSDDFGWLDEILYHLYESGGNSKYIRADHVGRPLSPDHAKQAITTKIQSLLAEKDAEMERKVREASNQQALEAIASYLDETTDMLRKRREQLFPEHAGKATGYEEAKMKDFAN